MIPRITPSQLHETITKTIARGKASSFLRIGDGEYDILRYPANTSRERCLERIGRWFDVSEFTNDTIAQIQRVMLNAYTDCDYLGIPSAYVCAHWGLYGGFESWLTRSGIVGNGKTFFYHDDLQMFEPTGEFSKLVKGLPFVGLITCRDVKSKIQEKFQIGKVEQWLVAGETFKYKPTVHVPSHTERHWPDAFFRFKVAISQRNCAGEVWLVGAGGLAKPYCQWIKESGGIAIDIGTLFDGWAGVDTRPYLQEIERFKL